MKAHSDFLLVIIYARDFTLVDQQLSSIGLIYIILKTYISSWG